MVAMPSKSAIVRFMVFASFVLIAWLVYTSWDEIRQIASTAQWYLLAMAIVSLTLANVGMAVVFAGLMQRALQQSVPSKEVVGSFLLSQVAKYIPGKVWGVAMQTAVLHMPGATRSVLSANLELAIVNMAMVAGIGVAILAWQQYGLAVAIVLLVATWDIGGRMLDLDAIRRIAAFIQRKLPRLGTGFVGELAKENAMPDARMRLSRHGGLLLYLLMYCLGWWLLVNGATQLDVMECLKVVAALSLSYVVGVVSMLPAGIGAREGALVLLAPAIGIPHVDMAAIAVTSRVAMVVMDALAAGVGAILLRAASPGEPKNV